MKGNTLPGDVDYRPIEEEISQILESSSNRADIVKRLKDRLYQFLTKAAEVEHLLAMQYLYACFSMKKCPEEFEDYDSTKPMDKGVNLLRIKQIESIRRWEAKILYVSRQEMEHLNLAQNLLAILNYDPFLYRPNYPVSKEQNPLKEPINLMRFSQHAIEVFRFWEKPDHLTLNAPFADDVPKGVQKLYTGHPRAGVVFNHQNATKTGWDDILNVVKTGDSQHLQIDSIEQLYTIIRVYFYYLLKYKLIEGTNLNRIVEEHFGFNMTLDPIVEGKYYGYVDDVITQIMAEGEGVWGVPPPLDSHFTVFQQILDEMAEIQKGSDLPFDAALPVVWNPTISNIPGHHSFDLPKLGKSHDRKSPFYNVTNTVAREAMDIYNGTYNVLIQMLYGFFRYYSIDYTTGIRPPIPNAFFSTAFYPFMTMIIRPLGEIICRLPADENFIPDGGKVPPMTAGPNFFLNIEQNSGLGEINEYFAASNDMNYFMDRFNSLSKRCEALAKKCAAKGYHIANYQVPDARDFDVRLSYMAQNFERIGQNFQNYWEGKIVAPIPSRNFQNFSDTYN